MISSQMRAQYLAEIASLKGQREVLDALDQRIYTEELTPLKTDAEVLKLIAEIRRSESYRPTARRVREIIEGMLDPADLLPPAQAEAYREFKRPSRSEPGRAIEGSSTVAALVSMAQIGEDTEDAWEKREQSGRYKFLQTVAGLIQRSDTHRLPAYQRPEPKRSPLADSLRAAGFLPAAGMLTPEAKAQADAELARIREQNRVLQEEVANDIFADLYCLLDYETPTPYKEIYRALTGEGYAQEAIDAALRIALARGVVVMEQAGKASLWRLASESQAERRPASHSAKEESN